MDKWGGSGKFSLYLEEQNIILEKGGGAKESYFGQIYTPGSNNFKILFFQEPKENVTALSEAKPAIGTEEAGIQSTQAEVEHQNTGSIIRNGIIPKMSDEPVILDQPTTKADADRSEISNDVSEYATAEDISKPAVTVRDAGSPTSMEDNYPDPANHDAKTLSVKPKISVKPLTNFKAPEAPPIAKVTPSVEAVKGTPKDILNEEISQTSEDLVMETLQKDAATTPAFNADIALNVSSNMPVENPTPTRVQTEKAPQGRSNHLSLIIVMKRFLQLCGFDPRALSTGKDFSF